LSHIKPYVRSEVPNSATKYYRRFVTLFGKNKRQNR
jgi:hypothetical protein